MSLRISRRNMLVGAGAAMAGGALAMREVRATAAGGRSAGSATTVILQDPRHVLPEAARRELAASDARIVELSADPVRQWREPSSGLLAARDTRLLGATSWPQFLMVRGLAEESGRRVRYQRVDVASGAIVWLIA